MHQSGRRWPDVDRMIVAASTDATSTGGDLFWL
jgi:hypothetical protein